MDQAKAGAFLAQLRHEAGLTQEQAGERLGVSNKSISRWENGVTMPDISLLPQLSQLYGVSINELLNGGRIAAEEAVQKADEVLIAVLRDHPFSIKERTAYFKRKWVQEHWMLIAFAAAVLILLLWLGLSNHVLLAITPILALIAWAWLHNRMMTYVEHKLYDDRHP